MYKFLAKGLLWFDVKNFQHNKKNALREGSLVNECLEHVYEALVRVLHRLELKISKTCCFKQQKINTKCKDFKA